MTETVEQPAQTSSGDPIVDSIMADITPIEEMSPYMRILIYGDTGVGKTTLASGAPNNLFIEADVGNLLALQGEAATQQQQNYKRFKYSTFEKVEQLADKARDGWFRNMFQTYTIDKLTDMAFLNLASITEREHSMNGLRNLLIANTDDRTENNERIRRLVEKFRRVDAHFIAICHYRQVGEKNTGFKFQPDFSEKLVGNLAGAFNIVGYMYKEVDGTGATHRMLRVEPIPSIAAKSNIDGLPPVIANPTWGLIYQYYLAMREKVNAQRAS